MRVVCFRKAALRERVSDHNAINELFFDIVFTVALSSARNGLESNFLACVPGYACETGFQLLLFFLIFAPFWFHAFQLVLYTNRFVTEEMSYNMALYVHMAVNVVMAVNAGHCFIDPVTGKQVCETTFQTSRLQVFRLFAGASMVSQTLLALQFYRVSKIREAQLWCYTYVTGNLLAAIIWLIGVALARYTVARHAVGIITMLIHLAVEIITKRKTILLPTLLPNHFAARMSKFAIVMLTQVLSAVIVPSLDYEWDLWIFVAGVLLLGFSFKILYFDFDQGARAQGFTGNPRATEAIWTFANLFLSCSFTAIGACVTAILKKHNTQLDAGAINISSTRTRWTLCTASGLAVIASVIIQLSLRGAGSRVRRWRKRTRIGVRLAGGLLMFTWPFVLPESWNTEWIVWPMNVVLIIQVLLDMHGRTRVANINRKASILSEHERKSITGEVYQKSPHIIRDHRSLSNDLLFVPHKRFGRVTKSNTGRSSRRLQYEQIQRSASAFLTPSTHSPESLPIGIMSSNASVADSRLYTSHVTSIPHTSSPLTTSMYHATRSSNVNFDSLHDTDNNAIESDVSKSMPEGYLRLPEADPRGQQRVGIDDSPDISTCLLSSARKMNSIEEESTSPGMSAAEVMNLQANRQGMSRSRNGSTGSIDSLLSESSMLFFK